MISIDHILNQKDDCSSLSAEESFTLEDILQEPDQLLQEDLLVAVNQDDFQGMFDDDDQQDEEQQQKMIEQSRKQIQQANRKAKQRQTNVANSKNVDKRASIEQKRFSHGIESKEEIKKDIVKYRRLRDYQMPPLKDIKNISFSVLKNVTALFQCPESKGVGIPTVIAATGSKFLAVGTSLGNTALFEIGIKGYKILGTKQHQKYGQVTAISISKDNKFMSVGQQNGLLTVWDLYYFTQLKKQLVGKNKIIKIAFVTQNEFVLNDNEGNIYLYTIEKYIWVNLKFQRILEKTQLSYYDIKIHVLQSNTYIIALCTLDNVFIFSFKPKVLPIAKFSKPENLYFSKIPNIQLGRCALFSISNPESKEKKFNDVICVSWSTSIFLYKFNDIGKDEVQKVQLIYHFQQPFPIYNMQFMSSGILVTLDNKQTFRTFRIWIKNDSGGHLLINQHQLPEEVIYQRFLKDKNNKYIKSYNNTIISCQFSPKEKELFFISKNSIYRCKIYRWNEVVSDLINDKQYLKALKICLQIYNSKLNIFLENFQISEKSMKLFCEIGRLFVNERLRQILKLNEDRVKNIYDRHEIKLVQTQIEQAYHILIEYMIEIKSQAFLFEKIYDDLLQKKVFSDQYRFKFLDCLQDFMEQGSINLIPSIELFKEITAYFLKKNRKNTIDSLIMSLDVESIFYTEAIQICQNNKLYKSLAYVCSTHGEYIPPLNKLLKEIQFAQKNNLNQAKEVHYMILKDYIVKLLSCVYINGNPLQQNPSVMKKTLSTWLTCSETFDYFTKNQEESFQKDYFYFLQGMIQSLCEQKESAEYIHSILKQLIKQKCKQKELTQLFIKLSLLIHLDQEEIQIIITHTQTDIFQRYLHQYLNFVQQNFQILQKLSNINTFIGKNPQIFYLYRIISSDKAKAKSALSQSAILLSTNTTYNYQLAKYILANLKTDQIAEYIEDLLKIHSESTMIYMLEKFQVDIVNRSVMNIKDQEYRYLIVRKLLKKIRKQQRRHDKTTLKKQKNKRTKLIMKKDPSESQSQLSKDQSSINNAVDHKQLGTQVMQFYVNCLCLYKKQKRIFYEFIYYLKDYINNLDNIIKIIQPYNHYSSLGLLEENRKNYMQAYKYFEKVYVHRFFEQNYKKLKKAKHCHGRFMRRIFQRMLAISQIINTEQQWLQLLICIISPLQQNSKENGKVCDYIQNVFSKKNDHPFLVQLGQILELGLTNVSNHVPMHIISEFISQHRQVFAYEFVLSSFRSTLVTYSKNSQFYKLTNEMMKNDQINQFQSFYYSKISGIIPQYCCQKCNKEFQQDQIMKIYRCGHSYHEKCKSTFRKLSEDINGDQEYVNEQDRCQKCLIINTGGNEKIESSQNMPDFNIYNENLLMKGMKGIANIIPSMISVIPNPINMFISKKVQENLQKSQRNSQYEEDEVFDYLAFENILKEKEQAYSDFIKYYAKQLQKY